MSFIEANREGDECLVAPQERGHSLCPKSEGGFEYVLDDPIARRRRCLRCYQVSLAKLFARDSRIQGRLRAGERNSSDNSVEEDREY